MMNKFPMTLLAQLDEVAVFQTAAFTSIDGLAAANQQVLQQKQPSYGELNLGLHVNDEAATVLNNRMRLLTAMNTQLAAQQKRPIQRLHWVNQVHGKQIHDIDTSALSMQPLAADAMVSKQTDSLGLAIMTADCVPVVLYQPATGQIAAIHAGWQGLACGIIKATVERFTVTGQVMAWMGACISQANYEVSTHVRDQLRAGCLENQSLTSSALDNFDQLYSISADVPINDTPIQMDTNTQPLHKTVDNLSTYATVNTDKIKLDLPKLAADQLTTAGVTLCTELPVSCSYADRRYYSYRRQTHLQQPATGRMALIIVRSASVLL